MKPSNIVAGLATPGLLGGAGLLPPGGGMHGLAHPGGPDGVGHGLGLPHGGAGVLDDHHGALMNSLEGMHIPMHQSPQARLEAAEGVNDSLRQALGALLGGGQGVGSRHHHHHHGRAEGDGNPVDELFPKLAGARALAGAVGAGGAGADAMEDAASALEQQNHQMAQLMQSIMASIEQIQAESTDDGSDDMPQAQAAAPGAPSAGAAPAQAPQAAGSAPPAAATAAPGGAQAQGPAAQGAPGAASTPDSATVLKGDNTGLLPNDTKCPAGVSMDDMMKANGGLLGSLGNQELKGAGAKGISGGIKDNLARMVGGKPGDIGKDPDVTYRALAALSAFKNTPGADGKPIPDDIRHNGNVSGLQPSHEVARGSTLGELQDWFKGAISGPQGQLPKGDKVNDQGVETSGAQQVGQKILKGLSDVAGFFKKAIDATIGKIPGIGKILSAPMDYVAGGLSDGLNAASLAAGGHMAEAKEAGKTMAHNLLKTFSQMSAQAESLVKATVGRIPGVGKLLAAAVGDVMNLEQGAANVADTALKGGDVKGAAINMGKNAAGAWVGNAIGIVDPTGLVSGAAENGVDHALGAQSQIIQ